MYIVFSPCLLEYVIIIYTLVQQKKIKFNKITKLPFYIYILNKKIN